MFDAYYLVLALLSINKKVNQYGEFYDYDKNERNIRD